ncbi:MAG: hypothetical protein QOE99_2185 [Actinomycetota bacterium]|jgi:transposase-like protein|nr:hypothetical protein [Actinomycetota bacterium]
MLKRCVTCHEDKSLDDFNLRRSAPDGRQPRCRDCCKQWYVEHRAAHIATMRERKRQVRAEYRERLGNYLMEHPCVDCGENDIRVLDFDHRPGTVKVEAIAVLVMTQVPWRRIEAEMAKCDVRCANCHRKRTAERGRHRRDTFLLTVFARRLAEECTPID